MSLHNRRLFYLAYLILLPLLLIGMALIDRRAGALSAMTYLPYHFYAEFFLAVLSGALLAADLWLVKNAGFSGKARCLIKLAEAVLLVAVFEIAIRGLFYSGPILDVSSALYAAGFQLCTAFYGLRGAESRQK